VTLEPSTITDSVISSATARAGTANSSSSAETISGSSGSLSWRGETFTDR